MGTKKKADQSKTKKELLVELEQLRTSISNLKKVQKEWSALIDEGQNQKTLFENILDSLTCGVWVTNEDDIICYANKGMEMIAGVTHQKLFGYHILRDTSESSIDYFKQHYLEAQETLQPVYYSEVPVLTPAGKQTYQSGWLIPRKHNNSYVGMICLLEDITNEKDIRKALRDSEAMYGKLVENVNSIIMRIDLEGHITFINKFGQNFFGYRQDEIILRNVIGSIFPDTPISRQYLDTMLNNIALDSELHANKEGENILKSGKRVWISWTNKALFDEAGKLTEILCVGNDITERKRNERLLKKYQDNLENQVQIRTAQLTLTNEKLQQEIDERKWVENVLRRSEEKYRLVVENANEAIVVTQDGIFKYVNPKAMKIMGYSKEELISRPFVDFIHPEDRDMVTERHLKRLKGDTMTPLYATRIVDRDGAIKWVEVNSVLITWMGRPATLAFFSNITERKNTLERLRLFESAIQQTKDSVIITTAKPDHPSAKIVFVNPAFTRMTGYTQEEVADRPSLILQGPSTENTEWIRLEGMHSQGKAYYGETVNTRKDGIRLNLEWQIAPIRNENGRITHFISTQRDITERKRAEDKLRTYQEQLRSLASELSLTEESERRRLATALHDHIGQTLAITKIKFAALMDSLTSGESRKSLEDIRSLLERTIAYTKSLTFELSPPILYELGFDATIEWLGEQIQDQYQIQVSVHNDGQIKSLRRDVSVLMFQAIRELFMNVIKHARAKSIHVSLQRIDSNIRITMEDDGIGFDPRSLEPLKSFGFFSIRERLNHFGGLMEIVAAPGKGTRVSLTAPLLSEMEPVG